MSSDLVWIFHCDRCHRRHSVSGAVSESESEARRLLADSGWFFDTDQDLCPNCNKASEIYDELRTGSIEVYGKSGKELVAIRRCTLGPRQSQIDDLRSAGSRCEELPDGSVKVWPKNWVFEEGEYEIWTWHPTPEYPS